MWISYYQSLTYGHNYFFKLINIIIYILQYIEQINYFKITSMAQTSYCTYNAMYASLYLDTSLKMSKEIINFCVIFMIFHHKTY